MLTHTTAWDRHWGGDKTLRLVLVYVVWLLLSYCRDVCNSASPHLMDPGGTRKCIFFTLNTYQATFIRDILLYDYRNWKYDGTGRNKAEGRTDVKVEIVM